MFYRENFNKLLQEKGDKEEELDNIKKTTIEMMWFKELNVLYKDYCKYKNDRIVRSKGIGAKIKKKRKKK